MFNMEKFIQGVTAAVDCEYGHTDIQFEGLLCSTSQSSIGKKSYFTVDVDGKAVSGFKVRKHLQNLNFNVVTDKQTLPKVVNSEKPAFVEVTRFFRAWDYKYDQISSYGGMTAICELDYQANVITVYPAFCHTDDKFDKAIGCEIASKHKQTATGFQFKFDKHSTIFNNMARAYHKDEIVWLNSMSRYSLEAPFTKAMSC